MSKFDDLTPKDQLTSSSEDLLEDPYHVNWKVLESSGEELTDDNLVKDD